MVVSESVEQVLGGLLLFALFYGSAVLICLIALGWARDSVVPTLAKILRFSAKTALVCMTLLYGLSAVAAATCGGNGLYGYGNCLFFSKTLANYIAHATILTTVYGLLYTVALFAVGAAIEIRARR